MRRAIWLSALLMIVPVAAGGAAMSQDASRTGTVPSSRPGELIAMGGGPGGTAHACFACHGIRGEGDAGTGTPRLAGLDARYLARQLSDYVEGRRENAAMEQIAKALSADQRIAVSLYYEAIATRKPLVPARGSAEALQRGAVLYAVGDAELGLQSCLNCHGPGGRGLSALYPDIAGQPATYVHAQLTAWRNGERSNDVGGVMRSVALRLKPEDLDAIAAYVAELEP